MYWFLIKSILSAVLGSQFYQWYASTKIGIYFQNRIDQFMEYISNKYDITLIKKQSKFERDYPLVMKRIEELELEVYELELEVYHDGVETIEVNFKKEGTD
jgi:hypothetical protein|tara:strand:- start:19 stop:321 length:303 start_codon:yes stop_codon:yes gene_type:complete